jgi:hypothetical protein
MWGRKHDPRWQQDHKNPANARITPLHYTVLVLQLRYVEQASAWQPAGRRTKERGALAALPYSRVGSPRAIEWLNYAPENRHQYPTDIIMVAHPDRKQILT